MTAYTPTTIREALRNAASRSPRGWLYLPSDRKWTLNTEGIIIDTRELSDDERDENDEPVLAKERGLTSTLDLPTLEGLYSWAVRLQDPPSDEALFEVFEYYYKFDNVPPSLGAPDPPPAEVVLREIDRSFYESLVDDESGVKCRHEGCGRDKVKLSAFCRVHHFENVMHKACPFDE
jgi:hypothetical protein